MHYPSRRELREAEKASSRSRSRLPESRSVSRAARKPLTELTKTERSPETPRSKPKRRLREKLSGVTTIAAVTGIFATVVIPAYASAPLMTEQQPQASSPMEVQSIALAADAVPPAIERDDYKATTQEELDSLRAYNEQLAATAAYSVTITAARAEGDDYPWPTAGHSLSPLNYYYRQCVDFVAWRLNRDAGSYEAPFKYVWSNLTPGGGNASQWKAAWEAKGWPVSMDPVIGAVAWFPGNHVAYVKSVNGDGTVTIEEYNGMGTRVYSQRDIPVGSVGAYLYPPPR